MSKPKHRKIILTENEWEFLKTLLERIEDDIYDYDYEHNCDGEIFYNKIKEADKYQ